jgi:hypothetical protein
VGGEPWPFTAAWTGQTDTLANLHLDPTQSLEQALQLLLS